MIFGRRPFIGGIMLTWRFVALVTTLILLSGCSNKPAAVARGHTARGTPLRGELNDNEEEESAFDLQLQQERMQKYKAKVATRPSAMIVSLQPTGPEFDPFI